MPLPAAPIEVTYVWTPNREGNFTYSPSYVRRLVSAVDRHLTLPHTHLVYVSEGTDTTPLGGIPHRFIPRAYYGWWAKLWLFEENRPTRRLFLDLDTIILRDINFLAYYDGPFAILEDFYRPHKWGSAIMNLCPGSWGSHVLNEFLPSFDQLFRGDQDWIFAKLSEDHRPFLWQSAHRKQILSYKKHCTPNHPPDEDTRVVCFHGVPKPHELMHVPWVYEAWCGSSSLS